jgi:uncharacterized protein
MWADEDSNVTILAPPECMEYLRRVTVGRIGVSIDALPVIVPVHFALFENSVLFRTIPGTKFDAATVGAVVAFQADAEEPLGGTHWSVLLQGFASAVTDRPVDLGARSIPIKPWTGVQREHRLVRVEATNVSGRRFRIAGEGPSVEFPDAPRL